MLIPECASTCSCAGALARPKTLDAGTQRFSLRMHAWSSLESFSATAEAACLLFIILDGVAERGEGTVEKVGRGHPRARQQPFSVVDKQRDGQGRGARAGGAASNSATRL